MLNGLYKLQGVFDGCTAVMDGSSMLHQIFRKQIFEIFTQIN